MYRKCTKNRWDHKAKSNFCCTQEMYLKQSDSERLTIDGQKRIKKRMTAPPKITKSHNINIRQDRNPVTKHYINKALYNINAKMKVMNIHKSNFHKE